MKKVLQYLTCAAVLMSVLSCNTDGIGGGTVSVTTLDARYATKSTVELCGATWGGVQDMLARGVCFSKGEDVGFSDGKVSVYPGEGEFSRVTHELEALTTYYIRAYAVMKDGTVHYGELKSFSTLDFTPAVIEIGGVTDILSMEATVNATIVSRAGATMISPPAVLYIRKIRLRKSARMAARPLISIPCRMTCRPPFILSVSGPDTM